ncbi:putative methyltransferase [Georgfuchsia toluolica]|uniref:Methyltransferase n=1 Tax=Georgfuchsia toluolica TaxID=424218 RepID=A0A916N325_9PROT|nr:16S rRNA (guanine(966)-N(2))-methyltransferase RsmD [Georgfuchsia toluolica]CAG4884529.1 putative methyltransferase [Georgfuchsia toluolica]
MSRIRVTGGEWRSRMIQVIDGSGLRPTPDRVRETLFNWLGQDLRGLRCLDLFAGSGILGFEAASRGAAHVTLVEKERRAFLQLQRNAAMFDDPRLQPIRADALEFAAPGNAGYDLIFLDPPYRHGWLEKVEPLLSRLAKPGARLYVEAEHSLEHLGDWCTVKQGTAGQVFFHLLEHV